jgi:hypothetical protein
MIYPLIRLSSWLLPVFLLTHTIVHAQGQFVYLTPHSKRSFHRFSFDKITVLDNRLDTNGICISAKGDRIQFARPVAECIGAYIRNATRQQAKGHGNLLLNIKRLQCTLNMNEDVLQTYMIFVADAYVKREDGTFNLLSRIQLQAKYKEPSIVTTMSYLLDCTINQIGHSRASGDEPITLDCINQRMNADWAAYPIINATVPSKSGFYSGFSTFRDDAIIPYPFRMKLRADGAYQLSLPLSSDIKAAKKIRGCWAVADSSGLFYIHLEHNIFLPLERRDNTFWFQVPRSLSDSHLVHLLKSQGAPSPPPPLSSPGSGFSPEFGSNEAALIFLGVFVVGAITYEITAASVTHARIRDRDRKIKTQTDFREAMFDMDSGAITYY